MKKIIWLVSLLLLILSMTVLFIIPNLCPDYKDILENLGIELCGLAISIPIIYFIIEKLIQLDRENRWRAVKNSLNYRIKAQAILILHISNITITNISNVINKTTKYGYNYFENTFPLNNNDDELVINEAKRIYGEYIPLIQWNEKYVGQLDYIVKCIEPEVKKLISQFHEYSNVLTDEPILYKNIVTIERKLVLFSTYASYRSYGKDGHLYIDDKQSKIINQFLKDLLTSIISLVEYCLKR